MSSESENDSSVSDELPPATDEIYVPVSPKKEYLDQLGLTDVKRDSSGKIVTPVSDNSRKRRNSQRLHFNAVEQAGPSPQPNKRGRPKKEPVENGPSSSLVTDQPKRGRGRPPKKMENDAEENDSDSSEVEEVLPKKRGRPPLKKNLDGVVQRKRGRPAKMESEIDDSDTSSDCSEDEDGGDEEDEPYETVKRKRGRPPTKSKLMVGDTVPRKRGRPPKNVSSSSSSNGIPKKRSSSPVYESGYEEEVLPEQPVKRKRGRPFKNVEPVVEDQPTSTEGQSILPKRRGRPSIMADVRLTSSEDESTTPNPKRQKQSREDLSGSSKDVDVTCGVCHKSVPRAKFKDHRYSMHKGLARRAGLSQSFSDAEKKYAYKNTMEKYGVLKCAKCNSKYSTVPGYCYHEERCGVDPEKFKVTCAVCGEKVIVLKSHMKTHERVVVEDTPVSTEPAVLSEGKTPRRAAAVKARLLFNEDESKTSENDGEEKKTSAKVEKYFVEPPGNKVTNSIIGAWTRQIETNSTAQCRHPSCAFSSDNIELLKEHHPICEVGLKLKVFRCVKCDYQSLEREQMAEHVTSTHVSVEEVGFEMGSEISEEDDDEKGTDEDETRAENTSSQPKDKVKFRHTEQMFGLSPGQLHKFKSGTSPCITTWLAEFHKKNFSLEPLFKEWLPNVLHVEDIGDYTPLNEESIPFGHRKISAENLHPEIKEINYETMKKFEGKICNGVPMFFCGGSILSSAWCPTPVQRDRTEVEQDQHLAVSSFKSEHCFRSASNGCFQSKYAIQILNFGKLRNSECPPSAPKLEFCIAHDYGRVWSIVWCPSGCYDESRLGVIAAACSDGTVRIFSVPQPNPSVPVNWKSEPSLTLQLNGEPSECTSLDWDSTRGHRYIVAGFADGTVAIWDLLATSPLLKHGHVLHPISSFYGHNSVVTAVSFSPHHDDGRFIATASEKAIKLWDRYDSAAVITESKRSRVTDMKFRQHWPGVLASMDDLSHAFKSLTMFHDFLYTSNRQILLPQNSVVWSVAENKFMDTIAHSTLSGEVVVYNSHFQVAVCDIKKLRKMRDITFRTDLVNTGNGRVLNRAEKMYTEGLAKTANRKTEPREAPEGYSLVFNIVKNVRASGKKAPKVKNISNETMDITLPSDDPCTSLNVVAFNPNFQSHTWMCISGENGLVQLLRIDPAFLPQATENYLKEMTK